MTRRWSGLRVRLNSTIPTGTVTPFDPSYSEALTTYGAPTDLAHSKAFEGTLGAQSVTCR